MKTSQKISNHQCRRYLLNLTHGFCTPQLLHSLAPMTQCLHSEPIMRKTSPSSRHARIRESGVWYGVPGHLIGNRAHLSFTEECYNGAHGKKGDEDGDCYKRKNLWAAAR